jgi:hypothetical protein
MVDPVPAPVPAAPAPVPVVVPAPAPIPAPTAVTESVLSHKVAGVDYALPVQGLMQKSAAVPVLVGAMIAWLEENVDAIRDAVPEKWRPILPFVISAAIWILRHYFGGEGAQTVSAMAVYNSPAPVIPVSIKSDGRIVEVVKEQPPPEPKQIAAPPPAAIAPATGP